MYKCRIGIFVFLLLFGCVSISVYYCSQVVIYAQMLHKIYSFARIPHAAKQPIATNNSVQYFYHKIKQKLVPNYIFFVFKMQNF